ncbi:MAG: cytochrome b/b6 domain-containing protein [Planctomycetes bacterium]|nr:cytochrome b/b6 domain-containing protein [Planctomycetota bacterium]
MESATSASEPRPLALRVWHWLNALAMFGALGTVLLRKTFLSWRTNAELIESRTHELGGSITAEGAVHIAKAIRAPMWEWHYIFGFTLIVLLVFRIVVALADRTQMPLRTAWQAFTQLKLLPSTRKGRGVHTLMVKMGYVVFYFMLLMMGISGTIMYFAKPLGLSEALVSSIKQNHELAMWFFVVFVPAHIIGVVVMELRGERGLVSNMIHGGKPKA